MNDSYGIEPSHLLQGVIVPVLTHFGMDSPSARVLVLGTGMVESNLKYLRQLGRGPARGLYQCEKPTHDDLYANYLKYNPDIAAKLSLLVFPAFDRFEQIDDNLAYATAVCRLDYRREREPLPRADDADGMARYHKRYYNSNLGATNIEMSRYNFEDACRIVHSLVR